MPLALQVLSVRGVSVRALFLAGQRLCRRPDRSGQLQVRPPSSSRLSACLLTAFAVTAWQHLPHNAAPGTANQSLALSSASDSSGKGTAHWLPPDPVMHPPCSVYGQFAIFIFAAWAGTSNGGVIAGLAICGVVVAAVSQAAVLMQVSGRPRIGA